MPRLTLLIHPDAIVEARMAFEWYRQRSEVAGTAFMQELDRAVKLVSEIPDRWPVYLEGTRRFMLRRFPFFLVYRVVPDGVEVIAVAHGRRRPGYWEGR